MNPLLIRRRGMMEAQQGGLPYDAEIEYLQSNGTQYIDSGLFIDSNNFEIGYIFEGFGAWGWVHQDNPSGTWILTRNDSSNLSCWYGNFGKRLLFNTLNGYNSIVFNSSNGITINNSTTTFQSSIGTDNISSVSLKFFLWYDFNAQAVETNSNTTKMKSFYVKINNVRVANFIPVRVGQVGYMYDRVSGQLFGNSGTGDFILGPDIQ